MSEEARIAADELLRCPFCNGRAELVNAEKGQGVYVACTNCHGSMFGMTKEESTTNWNLRHDGNVTAEKRIKLEIAEEIENHSYLAGTHEMCVWIDG